MQVCTHTHAKKTIITSFTCCKSFILSESLSCYGYNKFFTLYGTKGH